MSPRKNPAAVALGRRTSPRKARTSAANGALGGRPPHAVVLLREFAERDRREGNGAVKASTMPPHRHEPWPRLRAAADTFGWEVFGLGAPAPTVCPREDAQDRTAKRWTV